MDNYMASPGNAWEQQSFDGEYGAKNEAHRDKYFDRTDKGHYKLKDGYEQRSLGGSGDSLGAEMTYTTDWDDDDSGLDRKQEFYGIYKTSKPSSNNESKPAATPSPTTDAEPTPAGPVEYSSDIQEAKERVTAYENSLSSGQQAEDTYNNDKTQQAAQSFLDNKKYQFKA